jgi:hypothetical protein
MILIYCKNPTWGGGKCARMRVPDSEEVKETKIQT